MNQQRRNWRVVPTCEGHTAHAQARRPVRRGPQHPVVAAELPAPAPLAVVSIRSATAPRTRSLDRLTVRQREVLALMATGYSNAAIARHLVISEKAVVQHTSQIYDRLDLFADDDETHRRVSAVVQYLHPGTAA
jgi:DNA-binding NarL/FixJ family response regulator